MRRRPPRIVTSAPSRPTPLAAAAILIGLGVVVVVATLFWIRQHAQKPNVLLVTIDTLRADHLGSYGYHDAQTPVLDALAREGTRFTNAVTHVPLTLPSHASIFTGLTPPRHGVRNNPEFVLRDSMPTLTERFSAAGYDTAAFVSGFPLHRRFGLARGFGSYDDRFPRGDGASVAPYTERRANETLAALREWFEQRGRDGTARPFFVWAHFFDPHRPYDPPEPFRGRFQSHPYDGEISFVDAQIGELLQIIGDPAGRQTIVAVTSDHGEGLNDHGEPTHGLLIYDSTIRVPLIVRGPGIAAARTETSLVRLIDVAPTLLDLVELPSLPGIEGRSLKPILGERPSTLPVETAYVESMFGRLCCGWAPLSGWRDGPWMYIDAPEPELYNLESDPGQLHNVVSSHPSEVARFDRAVRAAARVSADVPGEHSTRPSSDSAERLAALGYFSGSPGVSPSLRDPKRMAALAERMENAIARERSDPTIASRELRAIVDADPTNSLARRHLAIALSAVHDYVGAIREVRELQRVGDTSLETTILLGECQRLGGQPDVAVRTLKAAAERNARNPDVLDALGRAFVAAGQRDAAIETFDRALNIQADDVEASEGLADLAIERGDLSQARVRLESLRNRDPEDDRIALKLGTVLARSGDLQTAIALFKSVVDRSARNVDALVNLAAALAKAGAPAEAVGYFDRAVTAGAISPVVLNGLAVARLQAGDSKGAVDAMRRSLALRPDQADIRELLQRVEADAIAAPRR